MTHEINPVEYGQLLEAVRNLRVDLENHTEELQTVRTELYDLRESIESGRAHCLA